MALRKGPVRREEYDIEFAPNVGPPLGDVRYELLGIKDLLNGGDLLNGDGTLMVPDRNGIWGLCVCIDGDVEASDIEGRHWADGVVAKLLVRKGGWIDAHAGEEFKNLWNVEAVEWRTNVATWERRPGRQDDCCSECGVYKHQRSNYCHLHFVDDKGGYVGDSEGFCHHVSCSVVQ